MHLELHAYLFRAHKKLVLRLHTYFIQAPVFWRAPYRALLNSRHLVEYMILDIESTGQTAAQGKLELADAQVARVADLGSNDTTYHVRTHLGHLLNPGDTALGYDLTRANFVDDELENFLQKGNTLPDVVLVSCHISNPVVLTISCEQALGLSYVTVWMSHRTICLAYDTAFFDTSQAVHACREHVSFQRNLQPCQKDRLMVQVWAASQWQCTCSWYWPVCCLLFAVQHFCDVRSGHSIYANQNQQHVSLLCGVLLI